MIFGILSGLFVAICQSITYLLTRHYAERRINAAGSASPGLQLVIMGHVIMGFFAVVLAPVLWPAAGIPWRAVLLPLLLNTLGYTCGQVSLVIALRNAEASRVSPLMTSKLIFSSILVMLYGGQPVGDTARYLTGLQWVAVGICVLAGISINFTGGKMKSRAGIAIVTAAMGFSFSDWNINLMIKGLKEVAGVDSLHASLAAGMLSYFAAGSVSIPLLYFYGSKKPKDWLEATPFAIFWFAGMFSLYNAFASIGILLGSILQCTRGFITIIFASVLMRLGHHHIEPKARRSVVFLRLGAGIVMFGGIALYVAKNGETFHRVLHDAGL